MFVQQNLSSAIDFSGKTKDKQAYLSSECVMGLYIPKLLTRGFLFSNDSCQIAFQNRIEGEAAGGWKKWQCFLSNNAQPIASFLCVLVLEWTLGALIYERESQSRTCVRDAGSLLSTANVRTSSVFVVLTSLFVVVTLKMFSDIVH